MFDVIYGAQNKVAEANKHHIIESSMFRETLMQIIERIISGELSSGDLATSSPKIQSDSRRE